MDTRKQYLEIICKDNKDSKGKPIKTRVPYVDPEGQIVFFTKISEEYPKDKTKREAKYLVNMPGGHSMVSPCQTANYTPIDLFYLRQNLDWLKSNLFDREMFERTYFGPEARQSSLRKAQEEKRAIDRNKMTEVFHRLEGVHNSRKFSVSSDYSGFKILHYLISGGVVRYNEARDELSLFHETKEGMMNLHSRLRLVFKET